jgi:CheY-like chemotaxis protein
VSTYASILPIKKLMKILFLNPHIDAQHKVAQALKARGIALLFPTNAEEGWQVLGLHASSVDLAIIHREGAKGGDPGVELLYKIKKDPSQADLPIIFTSETWNSAQCASHQQTRMGANAYLNWPFDETELLKTIDSIFAATQSGITSLPPKGPSLEVIEHPKVGAPASGEFILEDPAGFLPPELATNQGGVTIIRLESEESAALEEPPPELPSGAVSVSEGAPLELTGIELSVEASVPVAKNPVHQESGSSLSVPPSVEISMVMEKSEEDDRFSVSKNTTVEVAPKAEDLEIIGDSELEQEMPYLFSKEEKSKAAGNSASGSESFARAFTHAVGDAVVPGGAVNAPDVETLKKYLNLREQDVAALSVQLKAARDELSTLKSQYNAEKSHAEQMEFTVSDQKRKIEDFEREKVLALEGVQAELGELRFQNKAKADKAKLLETQVREASQEIDRLKERVRSDIRKIRVRERELENKLEISKKDSEAILTSRENKIIELKRKLDLLEFNMDLLQDRYAREKENSTKLREKLVKAAQVVRVAEGLLDEPSGVPPTEDTQAS